MYFMSTVLNIDEKSTRGSPHLSTGNQLETSQKKFYDTIRPFRRRQVVHSTVETLFTCVTTTKHFIFLLLLYGEGSGELKHYSDETGGVVMYYFIYLIVFDS